jgi:biopolymer transport protein TolR
LIDVLIVVLIFLMVTTTFKQQPALKLALAESTQPKAGASADAVIVTIPKSGPIYFKTIPVTMEALEQRLKEAAAANPDVTVSIRADDAAPWGEMVKVRDAAYAAKIKNVNASVKAQGQP